MKDKSVRRDCEVPQKQEGRVVKTMFTHRWPGISKSQFPHLSTEMQRINLDRGQCLTQQNEFLMEFFKSAEMSSMRIIFRARVSRWTEPCLSAQIMCGWASFQKKEKEDGPHSARLRLSYLILTTILWSWDLPVIPQFRTIENNDPQKQYVTCIQSKNKYMAEMGFQQQHIWHKSLHFPPTPCCHLPLSFPLAEWHTCNRGYLWG